MRNVLGLTLEMAFKGIDGVDKQLGSLTKHFNILDEQIKTNNLHHIALEKSLNLAGGAIMGLVSNLKAAGGAIFDYSKSLQNATTSMSALIAVNSSNISSTGKLLSTLDKYTMAQKEASVAIEGFRKLGLKTGFAVNELSDIFKSFYSTAANNMSLSQALKSFDNIMVAAANTSISTEQLKMTIDSLGAGAFSSAGELRRWAKSLGLTNEAMQKAIENGKFSELLESKTKEFSKYTALVSNTWSKQYALAAANIKSFVKPIGDALLWLGTNALKTFNLAYDSLDQIGVAYRFFTREIKNAATWLKQNVLIINILATGFDKLASHVKQASSFLSAMGERMGAVFTRLFPNITKGFLKIKNGLQSVYAPKSGDIEGKLLGVQKGLEQFNALTKKINEDSLSAATKAAREGAKKAKELENAYKKAASQLKLLENAQRDEALRQGKILAGLIKGTKEYAAAKKRVLEAINNKEATHAQSSTLAAQYKAARDQLEAKEKQDAAARAKREEDARLAKANALKRQREREERERKAAHEKELREQAAFLKDKNNQLEKYYIEKGNINKAWDLRKKKISKEFDKLDPNAREFMLKKREEDFKASFARTNEEMQTSYLETLANMRRTTQSVFFDFLDGRIKTSTQLFKRLGQSFASSLLNPLINGISSSLSGALGKAASGALSSIGLGSLFSTASASGLGGAAAGGGLASLLTPISNMASLVTAGSISGASGGLIGMLLGDSSLLTEGITDFAGGLSAAGEGLSGFSSVLGTSTQTLAGFGVGLASNVLGGFGIGKLAGDMMDKLFGSKTHAGQYGAIGAAVGSILPGVGTIIGGAIGSVIGGMFGKWEHVESGLALASDHLLSAANHLTNTDVFKYDKSEKKSWFGDKEKTEYGQLQNGQLEVINTMFDNVHALAARLGADLDRLVIKAGHYMNGAMENWIIPDTLLNSFVDVNVGLQDFINQRFAIIQAALKDGKTYATKLNEMFGQFIKMSDSMSAYVNRGNPVKVAFDAVGHSLDALKMLMRNVKDSFKGIDINSITNIAQITATQFSDAMNESLHSNFSPQNLALWEQLGQAFAAANESVKKLLDTVINKTAELSQSMGNFMNNNGMSGGIMQVGSLIAKYEVLMNKLEGKMSAKFKEIFANPFNASSKLAGAGLGTLSAFLANDKDGYKKALIDTLNSLKGVFDKQNGLAFSVPALDKIAQIDKQLEELNDPNSAASKKEAAKEAAAARQNQLKTLQEQLDTLKKQESILRKLHNQAANFRSIANNNLDYVNRAFNETLAAAKDAFAKGDFDSKVYDELSKIAGNKAALLKDMSVSEADYKFGLLQMANALDSVGGKKDVKSVQDEIKVVEDKLSDLKKQISASSDENAKSTKQALEEQRSTLIEEAQKQVNTIKEYLGNGSPVASYLQAVIDGVRAGANVTSLNINGLNDTMGSVGGALQSTIESMTNALNSTLHQIKDAMNNSVNHGSPNISGGGGSIHTGNTNHTVDKPKMDAQHRSLIKSMLVAYSDVNNWWHTPDNNGPIDWLIKAGYDASLTNYSQNMKVMQELTKEFGVIMRGGEPSTRLKKLFNLWAGAFHPSVTPLAKGGIVTAPTNALIGEAGYPEAVIPLKNGAGLKVDISGFGNLLAAKLETLISLTSKVYETGKSTAKNTNISMRIARDNVQ